MIGDRGANRRRDLAAWALLFTGLAWLLHARFAPVPTDADTAYHVVVGRLIAGHGLLESFPWTPFSWLADHWADKELAFHLLLAPLAGLDWKDAAHVVGAVGDAAILTALLAVLRAERVPLAPGWAVVPLLASPAFVFRFMLVRPHLFSVALAVLVLWAAARERLGMLALLAALYPWFYVAWQLPLALVAVAEAARLASGCRPGWRPVAAAAAGLALGVALHPDGWNLVRLSRIVLEDVLVRGAWVGRADLELGLEFDAFRPDQWARLLVVPAVMALAALALAWRERRADAGPLAYSLAALAFGLLTVRTARFAEYFVPLAALAFAVSSARASLGWRPARRRPALVLAVTAAVCLAYGGVETASLLSERLATRPDPLPDADATVMRATIPPGAQVFTCQWGLTGRLMLELPERRFMVALDPTLFALHDPARYEAWFRLPREAPPGLAAALRGLFGARYVACLWEDRFRPFFDRLAFEPGVRTLLVSEDWNVYELGDP